MNEHIIFNPDSLSIRPSDTCIHVFDTNDLWNYPHIVTDHESYIQLGFPSADEIQRHRNMLRAPYIHILDTAKQAVLYARCRLSREEHVIIVMSRFEGVATIIPHHP